jgi:hypothetical protein
MPSDLLFKKILNFFILRLISYLVMELELLINHGIKKIEKNILQIRAPKLSKIYTIIII